VQQFGVADKAYAAHQFCEAEEKTVGAMSNTPEIAERQFCASGNAVNVHLWMGDGLVYKRPGSNNFEDG
jgi:hypothetical protein